VGHLSGAGQVSNEIAHAIDLFPTLAELTGARVPTDRPIDGVDQSRLWLGETQKSARESIIVFCADRLQAVKWRNYKIHFYFQDTMVSPPEKLGIPLLINLYTNPTEDETKPAQDSWVAGPALRAVAEFEASTKRHPLIPMGTPDPYRPPSTT
jgi:arylsulfatase